MNTSAILRHLFAAMQHAIAGACDRTRAMLARAIVRFISLAGATA